MILLLAFTAVLFLKGTEDWAHVRVWKSDLFSKLLVATLEGDSEQKSQECCWLEQGSKTEWTAGAVKALTETLSDPSPCL